MAVNFFPHRLRQWLEISETAKAIRLLNQLFLASGLGRFAQSGHHLLIQGIGFICRLAEKSIMQAFVKAVTVFGLSVAAILRNKLIHWGLAGWKPVFEAAIILIVVLMPILNSWELLLPLLMLLWLCSEGQSNPIAKELWVFWLALIISACFSGSLRFGMQSLITYSSWLGITYLSGKVFSWQFSKKLLHFLVFTSLFWLSIGLMQQWVGVPTPPGWLGQEQSNLIAVRSYSLFGNPNIYALYLVSMVVLTCYLMTDSMVLAQKFSRIHQLLLLLLLLLILVALYFTYSRIAWILGIIFLAFWFWPKLGKWRWPIIFMVPLFLVTLQGFKVRMATLVTLTDSSLWYRVRIWQGVIKALSGFWLWGAGPGSFGAVYPWYQIKDTISAHAHQIFLQLWLENGILSLVAFLWLIKKMNLGITHTHAGADHQLTKAIAIVIVIFLGYGLTETWFQSLLIGGYFWLFCGLWISSKGEGLVAK